VSYHTVPTQHTFSGRQTGGMHRHRAWPDYGSTSNLGSRPE